MKSIFISCIILALAFCQASAQRSTVSEERPKISVNGEAVVSVTPDKIVISLGIETWDKDISEAKKKNNSILALAIAAIRERGVPDKGIQTDNLSIEPRWNSDYRKEEFIGYFVRNTIVVTLSETDKVEDLITGVLRAGITHIHGLDFQTTEFKKYREKARELALLAAREKAEKMAAALDLSIGNPIQINEDYSGSPWWYWSGWSGWGRSQGMSQTNVQMDSGSRGGEVSETIALGKISVRANVSVVFELK
jgi:uncharacterized protein